MLSSLFTHSFLLIKVAISLKKVLEENSKFLMPQHDSLVNAIITVLQDNQVGLLTYIYIGIFFDLGDSGVTLLQNQKKTSYDLLEALL